MEPLHEYATKRNFGKTREPGAKLGKRRATGLTYVIQEHHASHLHYDFRLEWDGVLKSWAVPKGPSSTPGDKRLAVQVEDHPLSYGSFEGAIPKGEYGAGKVYQWDKGTWEPKNDAAEGFRKGRLEFALHGKRLHGNWLLVRTKLGKSKAQWLLIKRHDDQEHPAPTSTARLPAKRQPMPGFIAPQLARLVSRPPEGAGWLHEVKYDGYRLQIHVQQKRVTVFTRNGNDWTDKFPSIVKEFSGYGLDSAIVDGEAVVLDENGRSNFQRLQNALELGSKERVVFYAFDLLFLGGQDLRKVALVQRKAALKALLERKSGATVIYSEHFEVGAREFLKSACQLELEGIVSKRATAEYSSGRGDSWVKSKCSQRQEFVIGGYTEPDGSRSHFGALLVGVYQEDKLRYTGKVGTGFSNDTLKTIFTKLKKYETDESSFALKSPRGAGIHWIEPKLVAEVEFSQWTKDGLLRAPVFQGLRTDKKPAAIIRERPETPPEEILSKIEPESDPFTGFTHPEKVLFAKPKVTKRDLADYYSVVAPRMLPHLKDRPLSLLRCPQGIGAACFFQKHFHEGTPKAVTNHKRGPRRQEEYVTLESPQGLISLVQRGAVEIHAQNGRAPDPSRPGQLVIDFDPGSGVAWPEVRQAAFDLKQILDELKLTSFVKSSGGKGLHVHVPFSPEYPEEDVKAFAHALADAMVKRHPGAYTANMAKKEREGKVFVDYLRNGHGSSAVAPYSVRAREGAPVALPITWKELKDLRGANLFSLKQAMARMKTADPWAGFELVSQKLPLLKKKAAKL